MGTFLTPHGDKNDTTLKPQYFKRFFSFSLQSAWRFRYVFRGGDKIDTT